MKARNLGALFLFVVLATANSGGYRYGVGDQAFYQPAAELQLHPELFPRDRTLIQSQAKLTVVDEALAVASRVTRLDLPELFFILYVLTLIATVLASAQLANVMGLSPTATWLFLTVLTLRHRIAKTGANTLEGYMHPRQLAFAIGVFALTASFKRRWVLMSVCWVIAAIVHPTTALWFAAAIAGGIVFSTRQRQWILVFAAFVVLALGPFLARSIGLITMDDQWLSVLSGKDYLFASGWPFYAWMFNLAYVPLILYISVVKRDTRLVGPAIALLACFIGSYSMTEAHIALAVQLQISRVFWLLDFMLALAGAWLLCDSTLARRFHRLPQIALAAAVLLATGRGIYTLHEAGLTRAAVAIQLPADDWTEAMAWVKSQPPDLLVLASPDHAWKYGTSVRVASSHDVVLEDVKDSAISMYDRGIAMRTAERLSALGDFDELNAADARALGGRYGAGVLVTEAARPIDLPILHRNATFIVYDIR